MIEFSLGRCKVKIRFLFFAVLGFLLFSSMGNGAIFGLLAAVLHELGHFVVMYAVRVPPRAICLNPFGIDIVESDDHARSYGKDILISLAGPAANGLAWLLGYAVQHGCGVNTGEWMLANLAIGLMNLVPIDSLDGGQAVYSALCIRHSERTAGKIITILSLIILVPLATAGFFLLLKSRYNFSLLLISLYLMFLLLWKRGRYFHTAP